MNPSLRAEPVRYITLTDRYSIVVHRTPAGLHIADFMECGKRIARHSAMNWEIKDVLPQLKRNIAESDFATDAEKAAAERIAAHLPERIETNV